MSVRTLDETRAAVTARTPRVFVAAASLALVAAVAAAVAQAVEPFAHGVWLVAYLVLVGCLAQFLLGRGQALLAAASPAVRAEAILWNAGVVAVPLGVLAGARLFVVLGGLALLAALARFAQARRPPSRAAPRALAIGYAVLILFMAASVLVGTALAWDIAWL